MRYLIIIGLLFSFSLLGSSQTDKDLLKERIQVYELDMLKVVLKKIIEKDEDIDISEDQQNKIDDLTLNNYFNFIENNLRIDACGNCDKYIAKLNKFKVGGEKVITSYNSIIDTSKDGKETTLSGWQSDWFYREFNDVLPNAKSLKDTLKPILVRAEEDIIIKYFTKKANLTDRMIVLIKPFNNAKNQKNKLLNLKANVDKIKRAESDAKIKDALMNFSEIVDLCIEIEKPDKWGQFKEKKEKWHSNSDISELLELKHSFPFPFKDNECKKFYISFIKGVSEDTSKICYKYIDDSKRGNLEALKNVYEIYKEKEFAELGTFKLNFKNHENEFKGFLKVEDFITQEGEGNNWIYQLFQYGTPLIFCLLLLGYLINKRKKSKKDALSEASKKADAELRNKDKSSLTVNDSFSKEPKVENESELLKKINELEKKVEKQDKLLQENIEKKQRDTQEVNQNISPIVQPETSPQENNFQSSKFFALRPDGDGGEGFLITNLSQDTSDNYYYELNISGDNGTFKIRKDTDLEMSAAKSANSILADACKYDNMPFEIKSGINTTEPGKVEKDGNQWRITEKARIRFV